MVWSVQFDHCGRRFELCPAWPAVAQPPHGAYERAAAVDPPPGHWPVVPRWLAACDTWRLRALADEVDGGPGVLQQRDTQVHAAITRLLQQGRLRLFELTPRRLPDQQVEQPPVASQAVTPSMLRGARADEPTPAAAPADTAALAIDPDRQADVLRRAAEHGTPFCEECEQRPTAPRRPAAAALEPT